MIEHKLREIQKIQINGIEWTVLIDDIPDRPNPREHYWYADTYHRRIVIGNVIDDEKPFAKYLIWKIIEQAKMQYKTD